MLVGHVGYPLPSLAARVHRRLAARELCCRLFRARRGLEDGNLDGGGGGGGGGGGDGHRLMQPFSTHGRPSS